MSSALRPRPGRELLRSGWPARTCSSLRDRARAPGVGRLLLIFDDVTRPLRHVSFDRVRSDPERALADFEDSLQAFSKIYDAPPAHSERRRANHRSALATLSPVLKAFQYPDLLAKISILNMGRRGILVSEVVEVPWPVRADAPTLR
jgi:hypothetical protein